MWKELVIVYSMEFINHYHHHPFRIVNLNVSIHITGEPLWLVSVIVLLSLFFHAVITSKQDMKEIKMDCYPRCIFIWPVHFYVGRSSEWEGGMQLVEAVRYKPEVRGFDSRWCHWKFSLT